MAGGTEDHFTESRELYVLVDGDEWAHVEALDPDAGYWARRFAQLVSRRGSQTGRWLLGAVRARPPGRPASGAAAAAP
jgi:hypothetical protein